MSTVTPTLPAAPAKVSWLKKAGQDIAKAFDWLGSAKGQAVVGDGEAVAQAVDPALTPIIGVINTWAQSIEATEAKGAAAASLGATATGAQKASAAIQAVLPDVEADLKAANLQLASTASTQVINDAIVTILNEFVPAP